MILRNMSLVKINIHEQIYKWRQVMVERHEVPLARRVAFEIAGKVLGKPALFRMAISGVGEAVRDFPRWMIYNPLNAWGLHREVPEAKVVCSAAPELAGNRDLANVKQPHELNDVNVAVVRARFGVAETGSVYLSEDELQVNVLGFLAQHIVVLLDPDEIVGNLHQVYHRLEFKSAHYAVLMTGPSLNIYSDA